MTRGGSQEDPVQLLRDLQDSMEREADLREQLRYAEEEVSTLLMAKKFRRTESQSKNATLVFIHLSKVLTFNSLGFLYPPGGLYPTHWYLGKCTSTAF